MVLRCINNKICNIINSFQKNKKNNIIKQIKYIKHTIIIQYKIK